MAEDKNAGPSADEAPATRRKRLTDTTLHTAPSVRVFTDWTPQRLRSAERQAEGGDLSQAVWICEWLLTDDRIAGLLDTRIDQLLGLVPTFEHGTGRRAKVALKALEADEDWWEAYPESELRSLLRWGLLLGAAPARHNWTERADHGGRMLPMPTFWHPQTLRYSWQRRVWTVRDSVGVELVVTPGDGEWILHTPFGAQRPWAHGLWRSLSRWVLLKQFAMGDWARHSANGTKIVATAPEGATPEQRRELADEIANSGTDATIALPAGFDMKLLEATADTKAIYQAQIDAADNSIAIRIRGGNLTTQVKGGSLAATESQAKTGDGAKLKFDATSLATTLNQQSLTYWAEFNYGDRKLAPWPEWPVEPEEDKTARATMVSTLADGLTKMAALGFEIDPDAVKDEFDLDFLGTYTKPEPIDLTAEPANDNGKPVPGKVPAKKAAKAALELVPQMKAETGHIDGQLFVEDLREDAQGKAGRKLKREFVAGLLEAIQGKETWEEVRAAVIAKYRDSASPEVLREITRKAMVLADLAGTYSVFVDE